MKRNAISRRSAIQSVLGVAGVTAMALPKGSYAAAAGPPQIRPYGQVKITKLETFLVKPRWIFLKIHTDAGGIFGKALEPYQPMFVEEPCQAQNVDTMVDIAKSTHLPIAPHNPMGPISLAVGLNLAASIPNFLVQEQVTLGDGYLKEPFKLQSDGTVMIPNKPGLGVELDEDQMKDKIGHDWKNRESYDPLDGSVVDW